MKTRTSAKLWLLLALLVPAALVQAQATSGVHGTIESVMLDEHAIVIDGKQLVVREAELVVTYKGREVRAAFLSAGRSVTYSTRADGSISEIALIGPADELEQIDKQ